MKKHLLFLLFQVKASLRALPRILFSTVILALVVISVGFCGSKIMSTDAKKVNANIEIVIPPDDTTLLMAFQIYTNMDSIASIATCHLSESKEAAFDALEEGRAAAVVVIPSGFIDGILNGTNIPANVYLPPNAGIESTIFTSVVDAGVKSLAYVQSAIYAVTDVVLAHNMGNDVLTEAEDYLNDVNIDLALVRSRFYTPVVITSTGVSTINYYFATVILLLVILSGLSIAGIFNENSEAVLHSMKINGISKGYIRTSQYIGVGITFSLLFSIITIAAATVINKGHFAVSPSGIFAFIAVIFSVMAFIMFICLLSDCGLISTLLIFLMAVVMTYACGRILPAVFLPEKIVAIGNYLPLKHWCNVFETIVTNGNNYSSMKYVLLYGTVFFAGSIGLTYLRKGER